jgi:hypothetical protein
MGQYLTPSETRQKYIEHMGEPLGRLFYELWSELGLLYIKWNEYLGLFGERSRVDLLNQVAPAFFRMVQDIFWYDILMHIARLTDPPRSREKPNLTIRCLPELITDPDLADSVKEAIKEAEEKAKFCRDWRNRRIAHRDLHLALSESAQPLEIATRDKVQDVLSALSLVLNRVEERYVGTTTNFSWSIPALGGAHKLLNVLRYGIEAQQQRWPRASE